MNPFINKSYENRQKAPFEGDPTAHDLVQIAKHIVVTDRSLDNVARPYSNNYLPELEQQTQAAAKFVTETVAQADSVETAPVTSHAALARKLVENAFRSSYVESNDA